jgi:outer membrane protein assembly factor BamA
MIRVFTICFFFVLMILKANAQEEKPFMQTDTVNVYQGTRIVGIPVVFYTPETSFGIGGGAQFLFGGLQNKYNYRLSDMVITAVYTAKNQLLIDARPQIHFFEGHFFLEGVFRFRIFPNSFWGIGNNTPDEALEYYNMQSTEIRALLLKRIPPDFNFGFEYLYQHHRMIEYDSEGELVKGEIPGSEGAIISAFTTAFTFDDRNSTFSARRGNYIQFKAGFSSRVLGATYSYNKYNFDWRKYFPVLENLSIGAQYYMEMTYGDVPFQTKGWLGGPERTRGYFRGRYIDDQFYAVQADIRWRFHKRWLLNGFVSGGEVAYRLPDLYKDLKYSYGGGIRFQLSKKSETLIRLDFGFGKPGNSGIYFGVNEAF